MNQVKIKEDIKIGRKTVLKSGEVVRVREFKTHTAVVWGSTGLYEIMHCRYELIK